MANYIQFTVSMLQIPVAMVMSVVATLWAPQCKDCMVQSLSEVTNAGRVFLDSLSGALVTLALCWRHVPSLSDLYILMLDHVIVASLALLFGLLFVGPLLRAGYHWTKMRLTSTAGIPMKCFSRLTGLALAWFNLYQRYVPVPEVDVPRVAPAPPALPEPQVLDFTGAEFSTKLKDGHLCTVIRHDDKVYTLPCTVPTKGYTVEKKTATPIRDGSMSADKTRKGLLGFYRMEDGAEVQIGGGVRVSLPTARGDKDYVVTNFHVYEDLLAEYNLGLPVLVGAYKGGKFLLVEMKQEELEALHPTKLHGVDLLHFDYSQRLFQTLSLASASVSDDRRLGSLYVTSLVDRKPMISVTKVTRLAMPFMAAHTASTTPGWSGCPVYTTDGRVYAIHTCALNGAELNGLVLLNALYPKVPMIRLMGFEKESPKRDYDFFNNQYDLEADEREIEAVFGDPESHAVMFQDSKGRRGQLTAERLLEIQTQKMDEYADRADELAREYENGENSWALQTELQDAYDRIDALEDQIADAQDFDVGQADEPGVRRLLEKSSRAREELMHMMSGFARESNPGGRFQTKSSSRGERTRAHRAKVPDALERAVQVLFARKRGQSEKQAPVPNPEVKDPVLQQVPPPPASAEEKRGVAKESLAKTDNNRTPRSSEAVVESKTEEKETPVRTERRPQPHPSPVSPIGGKVAHEAGSALQRLIKNGHVRAETVLAKLIELVEGSEKPELASKELKDFIFAGGLSHLSPQCL